jgi:excisionase family DNA binding protein
VDFCNVWLEGKTMNTSIQIPASVKAAIQQQPADSPQFLLPEDRDEMLAEVGPEHQVEAEQAWNQMVKTEETRERHRRQRNGCHFREGRDNDIQMEMLSILKRLAKSLDRQPDQNPKTEGWMSTEQAAKYLSMTARGVRVAAENGRLPGHKRTTSKSRGNRWLFKRIELDKYLPSQKQHEYREEVSIWQ